MRVVIILFAAAGVLCAVVFIYLLALTNVEEALAFTVVLLVASIPLAIEIVTTTTLALGSRELAKEGAIVTRLSAIHPVFRQDRHPDHEQDGYPGGDPHLQEGRVPVHPAEIRRHGCQVVGAPKRCP